MKHVLVSTPKITKFPSLYVSEQKSYADFYIREFFSFLVNIKLNIKKKNRKKIVCVNHLMLGRKLLSKDKMKSNTCSRKTSF